MANAPRSSTGFTGFSSDTAKNPFSPKVQTTQNTATAAANSGHAQTSAADAFYAKIFPGATPDQITQYMRSLPTAQAQKIQSAAMQVQNASTYAPSVFDKVMQGAALASSMLALGAVGGAVIAPAVAGAVGGTAGTIAGGAAGGAATGAGGAALTGKPIGKGALMGGITGGIGAAAAPAANALGSTTGMGSTAANAVVKGGIGALGGELSGQGALAGGLSGVAGSLAGSAASGLGASSGVAGAIGKAAGGAADNAFGNSSTANGVSAPRATSTAPQGSNFLGAGMGATYNGAPALAMAGGGLAQGNNGNNMAGTDSTLAQTIGGAVPGLIQGAAGVYGSQNAAEAQTKADQNAINTQQSTLGNINGIWQTQQNLGQGADKSLGAALGTNGQPADYSGFENMPGYKFAQQQGTQAIQRQAASLGNAYTPNTAEAVGQYVTGTAMQDYNTYISQLMGAAGLGTTANQGLQTGNQNVGNNISQLQQNMGQAQASGVMGASNAVGGMFGPNGTGSSLIGAASKFLGGGGGSGGGGGGGGGNTASGVVGAMAPSGSYDFGGGSDYGSTNFGGGLDYGNGGGDNDYFSSGGFNFLGNGTTGGDYNFGGGLDYGGGSDFTGTNFGSDWGP